MTRLAAFALVLCFLVAPPLAEASDDGPVRLSDISRMIESGMSPGEVLVVARERGAEIRMTPTARRRLAGWGFNEEQVELARRIAVGLTVELPGDPVDAEGEEAGPAPLPTEFPIGYATSAGEVEAQQERIRRAFQGARLGYEVYPFERFSLYCSRRRAEQLVPALRELERDLVDRFPESIANATQPRTALLIVVDHSNDFKKMIEAIVASYRVDWPSYASLWDWQQISRWKYWVSRSVTLIDGGAYRERDDAMRYLSFGLGYMMMSQVSRGTAPGALVSGFGNVVEVMVVGSPSVTLDPYFESEEEKIIDWSRFVRGQVAEEKLPTVREVLDFERRSMEPSHCAVSWAMTSFLASRPDALFEAVYRSIDEEVSPLDAVLEAYGIEEDPLQATWVRAIGR